LILNKKFYKFIWVAILYFFSGLPLGFFYVFLPVFFRIQGIDLVKIGFFSSAGIFWSLKPFWAPIIDKYFYKKTWISLALLGISISLLCLVHFQANSNLFFIFLFGLTFSSAVLDTALDGFIIEWIEPENLGNVNGIRVSFYRIAMIFSGGLLTALSQYLKFDFIFYFLSFLTFSGAISVFLSSALKVKPIGKKILSLKEQYFYPLLDLFKRSHIFLIFIFIATYKIGDALLGGMVYPFWVDKGFSRLEIGLISGTLGSIFSILGSLIGGYYTSKWGVKKSLLIMGIFQALSNLVYAISALPFIEKKIIYFASITESFTGGLGTASFITFLTFLCKKEFSSTQYAIFSTLFSLTLVIGRSISGLGAKYMGYFWFFLITFFIALLPLLLISYIFKTPEYNKI